MLRTKTVWPQQCEERVPLVASLVEQKGPQEVYVICRVKHLTSRFKGRKWKQRGQFSITSSLFQRSQLVSGHLLHPGTGPQIPRGQHQEQPEFHADRHCCYACLFPIPCQLLFSSFCSYKEGKILRIFIADFCWDVICDYCPK